MPSATIRKKKRKKKKTTKKIIDTGGLVRCYGRCKQEKPKSEFSDSEWVRGSGARCRECRQAYDREHAHGVSQEDYDRLFKAQGGICVICSRPPVKDSTGRVRPLSVDHNHDTGRVRGLLHPWCNGGVGMLGDNPTILRTAAHYVAMDGFVALEDLKDGVGDFSPSPREYSSIIYCSAHFNTGTYNADYLLCSRLGCQGMGKIMLF